VFPPEVYCSLHTPADGLQGGDLIKAIEVEADVLVWPARRERGGGPDAESRRALALARVVLLLVTEEYAASPACAAEARAAFASGKLVLPVLLPGLARDAARGAEEAEKFWRGLAEHRQDQLKKEDALDWTLFGDHAPLLVTEEMHFVSAAVGELGPDSWLSDLACKAAARIASLLHRAVKVEVLRTTVVGPEAARGRSEGGLPRALPESGQAETAGAQNLVKHDGGGGAGGALAGPPRPVSAADSQGAGAGPGGVRPLRRHGPGRAWPAERRTEVAFCTSRRRAK